MQENLDQTGLKYFCFSPHCNQTVRIFDRSNSHYLNPSCLPWIASATTFNNLKKNYEDDSLKFINFTSESIQNLSQFYYKGDYFKSSFREYYATLKKQILTEIEIAQDKTLTKLNNIIQFGSQILHQISLLSKTNNFRNIYSYRVAQIAEINIKKIICLSNIVIPNMNQSKRIRQNLKNDLSRSISNLIGPKTEQASISMINNFDEQLRIQKQKFNQIKSLSLKQFIKNSLNISTYQRFFTGPNYFFEYDRQKRQVEIICPICKFTSSHQDKGKSECLKWGCEQIFEHLLTNHEKTMLYLFTHRIQKSAVREMSFTELISLIKTSNHKKFYIIDCSNSGCFEHHYDQNEDSFAVQLLYNPNSSHSKSEYIRAKNSKYCNLLLGSIIEAFSIVPQKKCIIYTNQQKKLIIQEYFNLFCDQNNIKVMLYKSRKQAKNSKEIIRDSADGSQNNQKFQVKLQAKRNQVSPPPIKQQQYFIKFQN